MLQNAHHHDPDNHRGHDGCRAVSRHTNVSPLPPNGTFGRVLRNPHAGTMTHTVGRLIRTRYKRIIIAL